MVNQLSGHIDRCIFSFVEMYKKLGVNMPELKPITDEDKLTIAQGMGKRALKYHLPLQTCATNGDYQEFGIHSSGCMTLDILGNANNVKFKNLKHKGMRANCNCIETRDIGWYDTCPNGCRYCYANSTPAKPVENFKLHNPNSPLLLGDIKETDTVQQGNQKSFLADNLNLKLF